MLSLSANAQWLLNRNWHSKNKSLAKWTLAQWLQELIPL